MSRTQKISLSVLSGVLLSFGWYEKGSGLILLTAFIPLLYLEDRIVSHQNNRRKNAEVFIYASATLFVWNLITTWWIKNASYAGLFVALILSTFLMATSFMLFSVTKRKWGRKKGYVSFIIFWIAFEFGNHYAEVSWPWLTLGNGFMFDNKLVQWYEFTGVFGGSLWVILVNILLYELIRNSTVEKSLRINRNLLLISTFCIAVPITWSLIRYFTYRESENPCEIVVVQPNVDPYMKFNDIPSEEQTAIQIKLAREKTTTKTEYIVCPETSINNNIWINQFEDVPDIKMIQSFIEEFPKTKFITGITCYELYPEGKKTATAKKYRRSDLYYDSYNSAIQIDSSPDIPIYHKSKLVVGVEKMPYPRLLEILKPLTLQLGGTFRSHGTQKEREVFSSSDKRIKAAPVICYESVYGEFVGDYMKKGANIIFVITNDGWWGDTPGHRQHNALSSLRAIENRRSVARSANTGVSSFINQKGDILSKLTWWQRESVRGSLNINNKITFYTKYGDYIGRIAFWSAVVFLLILGSGLIIERKKTGHWNL